MQRFISKKEHDTNTIVLASILLIAITVLLIFNGCSTASRWSSPNISLNGFGKEYVGEIVAIKYIEVPGDSSSVGSTAVIFTDGSTLEVEGYWVFAVGSKYAITVENGDITKVKFYSGR